MGRHLLEIPIETFERDGRILPVPSSADLRAIRKLEKAKKETWHIPFEYIMLARGHAEIRDGEFQWLNVPFNHPFREHLRRLDQAAREIGLE